MHLRPLLPLALTAATLTSSLADWPQWRGPLRDGLSSDTTPIADTLPDDGPPLLWKSTFIPSDHYGGHGSPIVAGQRVYLSIVWHERVPSDQREIDTEVMQQLNHRGTTPELAAQLEEARLTLSSRLRGDKLDAWIDQWVKDHLTESEQLALGSWVASRFRAGRTALPLEELDRIAKHQNKPFPTPDAFRAWIDHEQFSQPTRDKLLAAVPNTIKVARDTLVCLDLDTGTELWKFQQDGKPTGRKSSSTAAVVDGRVYAVGSTHLYCIDAETGTLHWKAHVPGSGPGASPLVHNGTVYLAAGLALAFDAATGQQRWEQKDARGDTGSPQIWLPPSGDPVLLFTGSRTLIGLHPDTGAILWDLPGGGQSTPVTSGDWLVFYSGTTGTGLTACQYQKDGPPRVAWSHFWVTRRYTGSPLIYQDKVYLCCGAKHQCLDLPTGRLHWTDTVNSTITSPLIADGKLIVYENNGSHLRLIDTDPTAYHQIARTKVSAMGCTSPALAHGRLIVRQAENLACYDLRPPPAP